jgi:hypothetical protein
MNPTHFKGMSRYNVQVSCSSGTIEKVNHVVENALPQSGIPGARVLAVARDGSTIFSATSGVRTLGVEDQPVTDNTVSHFLRWSRWTTFPHGRRSPSPRMMWLKMSVSHRGIQSYGPTFILHFSLTTKLIVYPRFSGWLPLPKS